MMSSSAASLAAEAQEPLSPLCAVDEEPWCGPVPRSGVAEEIGARAALEDAHEALDDIGVPDGAPCGPCAFYGVRLSPPPRAAARLTRQVFDGHGGSAAAVFARDRLLSAVRGRRDWAEDVPAALVRGERARGRARAHAAAQRAAFSETDEALRSHAASAHCGTTALAALLLGRTLYVANSGDSRAVLCRRGRAVELSVDHKPSSAPELRRITAAGGFVDSEGYLNGAVAVSRALGDWQLLCPASAARGESKPLKAPPGAAAGPLTGDAEVVCHALTGEDEFLLLACDGLWDVMSSQTAVELARQLLRQHNDPGRLAGELAREALQRHSGDNVTVLCVALAEAAPPARAPPPRSTSSARLFSRCFSAEQLGEVQKLLNESPRISPRAEEEDAGLASLRL